MERHLRSPRSETNWRALTIMALGALMLSAALALGVSNRSSTQTVERIIERNPQCFQRRDGTPSRGCVELARLLAQTCTNNRGLCASVVGAAVRASPRRARKPLARIVRREITRAQAAPEGGGSGNRGNQTSPGSTGGQPRPPVTTQKPSDVPPNTNQRPPATTTDRPAAPPATTDSRPSVPPVTSPTVPDIPVPPVTTPPVETPPVDVPCVPVVGAGC
jgi:hypothetical protein